MVVEIDIDAVVLTLVSRADDAPRNTDHRHVGWNVCDHDGIRCDAGICSD